MHFNSLRLYAFILMMMILSSITYAKVDVERDYAVFEEDFNKERPEEAHGKFEIWTPKSHPNKRYYFYPAYRRDKYTKQISNVVAAAIHKVLVGSEKQYLVPNIKFVIAEELPEEEEEIPQIYFAGSLVEAPGGNFSQFSDVSKEKLDLKDIERYYATTLFLGMPLYSNIGSFGSIVIEKGDIHLIVYDYSAAFNYKVMKKKIPEDCLHNEFFTIKGVVCNADSIERHGADMSGKKDAIQNLVNQLRSYLIRRLNCNYDEVQRIKSVFQRISDFLGISIKKTAFKKKSEFKSTSPNPSEENGEDEKGTGVMRNEL